MRVFPSISLCTLAILMMGIASCSPPAGEGSSSGPPRYDISGSWDAESVIVSGTGDCTEDIGERSYFDLWVDQKGSHLTLSASSPVNAVFDGTLGGNVVTLNGSFGMESEQARFVSSRIVVDSRTTFDGTFTLRWTEGGGSCDVSIRIWGSRMDPVPDFASASEESPAFVSSESSSHVGASESAPVAHSPAPSLSCGGIIDCANECASEDNACMEYCVDQGSYTGQQDLLNLLNCVDESGCSLEDGACLQSWCATPIAACSVEP